MNPITAILALTGLTTLLAMSAEDAAGFKDLAARAESGDTSAQVALAIHYRDGKAVATPGLQLITADDLKNFWRSDHYGTLSKGVLSRPAFVIAKP